MAKKGCNEDFRFTDHDKFQEYYHHFFRSAEIGAWLAELDSPLPLIVPIEKQMHHILKHAYVSDCNLAFVRMYGFNSPEEMIGVRFPQLFDNSESSNLINLRFFLQNNFLARNTETIEIARDGKRKYFLNDVIGVVENDLLVRVWGTQTDLTSYRSLREILSKLTPNQLKVLNMTVEGKTMKEIATKVGVSLKTVESTRNQLKVFFGVETVAKLIASAIRMGIDDLRE